MKKTIFITVWGIIFVLLGFLWCMAPLNNADKAFADNDLAFFKGKTVVLIVSTRPGGDYDFFGRLIASGLKKYLPGSTVIVKNIPGGGMVIGANEIYKAIPNGLTIGTFNSGILVSQLVKSAGVHFDLSKFTWLG